MGFFEEKDGNLIFRENGETVMLSPWGRDSLRLRGRILADILPDSGALLEPEATRPVIRVEDTHASITNGRIRAELTVHPWGNALQVSFYNQDGKLLLQEIAGGGPMQHKARLYKALPGGSFFLRASFRSDPGEKLYGMGQYQQEIFNLKGCNLELAHRNSQISIPFCVSSLGYGFLWNNPAIGQVHFGTNTTEWEASATRQLDYWITAGDTPAQIVEAYAAATGKVPMMPEYGLGFWQCKLRYYNQQQVLDVAREYHRRGIPVDVMIIDYYHWPRCGDWRFDPEYFPDPASMVAQLKEMGMETMVSVWPEVDWQSENYGEMKQQGLLMKSDVGVDVQMIFHGNNVFTDATNPRARQYMWEKCRRNYADLGIRAFWLDEAEPGFSPSDFDNYRYWAGPAAEVGNLYPREYARAFYEGQRALGQTEIVNLIRCAWAGSQRYGALVWSGDIMSTYEDFRRQICAGIHMGLAGIPWWNTDIGGFHGGDPEDPAFRELLVRWFQFGAFSPVMRLHGSRQPMTPIVNAAGEVREGTGAGNELWSYGEAAYPILLKFVKIRERMRPYTRSLMRQAHETGAPLIRALFYEFPQDPKCWEIGDTYLFGPDVLVAPVCRPDARSRDVYLPEGADWVHAGTGEIYAGGQTVTAPAPLDTLPVFLRGGRPAALLGQL